VFHSRSPADLSTDGWTAEAQAVRSLHRLFSGDGCTVLASPPPIDVMVCRSHFHPITHLTRYSDEQTLGHSIH